MVNYMNNHVVHANNIQVYSKAGSFLIELMTMGVSKPEEESIVEVLNRALLFLSPYHAKLLKTMLGSQIETYEKQYSPIPEAKITETENKEEMKGSERSHGYT